MSLPLVAVGALGGTIASTSGDGTAVVPTVSAADLAAAVPELTALARIRAETLAQLPSASLDEPTLLSALGWARTQVDAGAAGVVLTQGTDSIEETSYLLDLFWDAPEPLVVTGAMRSPQSAGADGPANLLAAVRAALAPGSRERGVLVAMADEVHLARRVAKTDALSPAAFSSPGLGPIGRHAEARIVYAGPPAPRAPLGAAPDPAGSGDPQVPLLTTHLGDHGRLLDLLTDAATPPHGVVVAGFGAGHVPAPMADAIGRAAARFPVVFATRTGAGPTGRAIYGYPGSEVDLLGRGAVGAGWLAPLKARLLLWALLATGPADQERIRAAFEVHGTP